MKEKLQEKENHKLCCLAWNLHLHCGLHKEGNSKTYYHHLKNVITHLKGEKSEMKTTRAPLSSCGWSLHTGDRKEETPETGSRDHTSIAPQYSSMILQPAPLGAAMAVTRSSPNGMHWQHHIYPSSTYILLAWGISFSRAPGCCSNTATQHQPNISHPDTCWCKSHCPSHSQYKTTPSWYSYRHFDNISICTINAQGICPSYSGRDCCWKERWKPWCPPRK